MENNNNQKNIEYLTDYGKGISYKGCNGQEYATPEQLFEANKRYYESMKINDSSKIKYPGVQPKLKFELKTEPVKDADGRIIQPSKYLDELDKFAQISLELQMLKYWDALTLAQKKAFVQIMAEQAEKNKHSEETSKKGK